MCVCTVLSFVSVKVKVSPLQATRDMDAKAHIYTARALGRGRVASPMLGRLYPRTHFIGG